MRIRTATILHSLVVVLTYVLTGLLASAQTQAPTPSPTGASRSRFYVGFARLQPSGPLLLDVNTVLRDPAGNPMTGRAKVTFSLYETETDQDPLWSEAQNVQIDGQGAILAFVGAFHPDGLPMELFRSGKASWLALQVNGTEQANRLPVWHLYTGRYSVFLDEQAKLEQRAAAMEAKGEDGSALRNQNQIALGFTDAEFAIIRDTNQRLRSELKQIGDQIAAIRGVVGSPATGSRHTTRDEAVAIVAERRARLEQLSPEQRDELKDLSRQYGAAISQAAVDLKVALGPELDARLGAFLEARIGVGCAGIGTPPPSSQDDPDHPCGSGRNLPATEEANQ